MCLTELLENEEKPLDFCEKFDLVLVILLAAPRNCAVEAGIGFSTTQCFQLSHPPPFTIPYLMVNYIAVSAISKSIHQVMSDSVQVLPYATGLCGVFN